MNRHTYDELRYLQNLSLELKIMKSRQRIREWVHSFGEKQVLVSFSGGKDSTVLLHLVRSLFPNVAGIFANTGLEYPEIVEFVKTVPNIIEVKPKLSFGQVLKKYGYPVISKEVSQRLYAAVHGKSEKSRENRRNDFKGIAPDGFYSSYKASHYMKWAYLLDAPFKIGAGCCYALKKAPISAHLRKTTSRVLLGTLVVESNLRRQSWLRTGCNNFNEKNLTSEKSTPLAFWTEQDILEYIYENNLSYSSIYGKIKRDEEGYYCTGERRTGCMMCGFGCHLKKQDRFQRLKETHPHHYSAFMDGGAFNDEGLWEPYKGYGFRFVLKHIGIDPEKIK